MATTPVFLTPYIDLFAFHLSEIPQLGVSFDGNDFSVFLFASSCHTPQPATNRSLASLTGAEMSCSASSRYRLLATLVVAVSLCAVLVAAAAALMVRRRRRVSTGLRTPSAYSPIYNVTRNDREEDEGEDVCFLRGRGNSKWRTAPVHV